MTLTSNLEILHLTQNFNLRLLLTPYQQAILVKCEKELTSGEVIQNWISKRFAMTFKIDPETWFRVTANPIHLPQITPYVKYISQIGLRGEKI